ncbi:MAG: MFS transporter [Acidimicrobiia bacterium]|nr:MFS transporter [Acidimicrobiia bacterium]
MRRQSVVVLGLATLTAALTGPGQTIGVSVFVDDLVDDLDLSREQVSAAYLVGTLTGAMLLPWVGRMIDRRGVRLAQIAIGFAFALALVNMSFVQGIVWLAIGFTGIRFLGQGSLTLASTMTVSLAFDRRRGTALGIFSTATSALMALVPVGLAVLIAGVGWRNTWLIAAGVVLVTVVPIGYFGLRSLPAGHHGPAHESEAGRGNASDYERREAMHTRSFWILASVTGSAGMLSTALNFHQIDLMGDAGISEQAAAALFLPQVIGSTIAGLGFGYAADRFGTRYLPAISMALLIAAMLLAAVISAGPVVIVYSITLGAMGGAVRVVSATLLPAWFGTTHLGSIQGGLTFFNVGASALGPVVLSISEAGFGAYSPAVVVLAVIPAMALVFSLTPDRHRRPIRRRDLVTTV